MGARIAGPDGPRVADLAEVLLGLDVCTDAECLDEEGEAWLDVRLQVVEGEGWDVWTGSPDYDTDHRGVWACGSVPPDLSKGAAYSLARELCEEVGCQIGE